MNSEPQKPSSKQEYEPPAIVAEEVFETLALSCSKAPASDCEFTPQTTS